MRCHTINWRVGLLIYLPVCIYIWRTTSLDINIIQNLDKGSASGELSTEMVDESKNTRPTSEQDYEEETDVDTDEENLNTVGV